MAFHPSALEQRCRVKNQLLKLIKIIYLHYKLQKQCCVLHKTKNHTLCWRASGKTGYMALHVSKYSKINGINLSDSFVVKPGDLVKNI